MESRFAEAVASADGPLELSFGLAEANLWLTKGLPDAYEGYFPPQIKQLMASSDSNQLVLRFTLDTLEVRRVVTLFLDTQFQGSQAAVHLDAMRGGLLPVPRWVLVGVLMKYAPTSVVKKTIRGLTDLLDGEPLSTQFEYEGRQLVVEGLEITNDRVTLRLSVSHSSAATDTP